MVKSFSKDPLWMQRLGLDTPGETGKCCCWHRTLEEGGSQPRGRLGSTSEAGWALQLCLHLSLWLWAQQGPRQDFTFLLGLRKPLGHRSSSAGPTALSCPVLLPGSCSIPTPAPNPHPLPAPQPWINSPSRFWFWAPQPLLSALSHSTWPSQATPHPTEKGRTKPQHPPNKTHQERTRTKNCLIA